MSQIKGKNTKPEILVRKFLFSKVFRFRLHDKRLPGKPSMDSLPRFTNQLRVVVATMMRLGATGHLLILVLLRAHT